MLSAARNAPITIMRPDAAMIGAARRRSPSGPGVCFHHATIRQACAANATASPGRSLIGRTARYQNSGQDATIAVAANAVMSRARSRSATRSDGGASEKQLKTM